MQHCYCMLQAKEDALQQELHTTRIALLHQVCHHCSHTNAERPDDVVSDIAANRLYSLSVFVVLHMSYFIPKAGLPDAQLNITCQQ